MGDDRVSMGKRMSHQVIVSNLEESVHGSRLVVKVLCLYKDVGIE